MRSIRRALVLVVFAALGAVTASIGCAPQPAMAQVPQAAVAWRADLLRNGRAVWGLDAPIATFAAQVHQESGWNPGAISVAGARGLAQFMPATARWISQAYPALRLNDPLNPGWALRALVQYDAWLHERVQDAADGCERWAFALSGYNGGPGWVERDRAAALRAGIDPAVWFDAVERVNAGRSAAAWRENRGYPRAILRLREPVYVAAGWGPGVCG